MENLLSGDANYAMPRSAFSWNSRAMSRFSDSFSLSAPPNCMLVLSHASLSSGGYLRPETGWMENLLSKGR